MSYPFFAYLSRLKLIRRWSLMRNTVPENDAEHSLQVAMIAHAIAVIARDRYGKQVDPEHVLSLAVYHDATEVMTGDLPTPVKYHDEELRGAYHRLEALKGIEASRHDDRRAALRQAQAVLPAGQHLEVPAAEHEVEPAPGLAFGEDAERVPCVGLVFALPFQLVAEEPGIGGAGLPDEGRADGEGEDDGIGLVRRTRVGKDVHPGDDARKGLVHLDGEAQMAHMERVEGAAEKGYALPCVRRALSHQPRTCPSPKTTNLVVVSSMTPMGP